MQHARLLTGIVWVQVPPELLYGSVVSMAALLAFNQNSFGSSPDGATNILAVPLIATHIMGEFVVLWCNGQHNGLLNP